jgi:hypothetical protein
MIDDPIVAEVRAVRDRHAAQFNYDLEAMDRDPKEKERASGRSYVRYPPRLCPPQPRRGFRYRPAQNGGTRRFSAENPTCDARMGHSLIADCQNGDGASAEPLIAGFRFWSSRL